MKKNSKSHHSTMNELNITPLLDLVFVLLVIFIITTPQLVNNLEVNLPSGKPPPVDHKPKPPTRINVSAAGQITLDDEVVTLQQSKDKRQALKAPTPVFGGVVNVADAVDYKVMVTVMDTLRHPDITKMGL